MEDGKCYIGLEISGSKIAAVAGVQENNQVRILAFSEREISPMEEIVVSGKVDNVETTSSIIDNILEDIISQTDKLEIELELDSVNINICNLDIKSEIKRINIVGTEGVNRIRAEDVKRLLNDAIVSYSPPAGYTLVHCLPVDFYVKDEITNSKLVGKFGNELSADFRYITVKSRLLNNLVECVNHVKAKGSKTGHFKVDNIYLNNIADSFTLLDKYSGGGESKREGVAIINIGSTFTDISVFKNNSLRFHKVIPLGGDTINQDLIKAYDINFKEAEAIKKIASRTPSEYKEPPLVIIERKQMMHDIEIFLKNAMAVVEWRLKEIITVIKAELEKSKYGSKLRNGIILTGGMANYLDIENLFGSISKEFNIRKITYPKNINFNQFDLLKNPKYTTLLGLIMSSQNHFDHRIEDPRILTPKPVKNSEIVFDKDKEVDGKTKVSSWDVWGTIGGLFKKDAEELNDVYEKE